MLVLSFFHNFLKYMNTIVSEKVSMFAESPHYF